MMSEEHEEKELVVNGLNVYELTAIVEAVHSQLLRYLRWTIDPTGGPWNGLEYPIAQDAIDTLASSYSKLMMTFKDAVADTSLPLHPEIMATLSIPNEVWDQITAVTLATDWENSPVHPACSNNPCSICQTLMEA